MKQFILSGEPDQNGQVRLEGGDYRYLAKVRRLSPGEYFPALLPGGEQAMVQVISVDSKTLVGELSPVALSPPSRLPQASKSLTPGSSREDNKIILFQALPKGEKMDIIVRQAAEGGIAEIVPFASEFSVPAKVSGAKFTRWERIIKEARQQSGSATETGVRQPVPMGDLFAYWEQLKTRQGGALGLLFHHLPLANISLHRYLGSKPETVVVAIGPEGGFSPAEAQRFMAAGFKPFTIEGPILRTETAALYAHAAVRILLLEKDSWEMK